ncbi:zinc finger and BTB domain-containing protein 40 isoform X5 [Carcharodon carcharias]|uniref:zinc finger and BTB domain-containing protein 40 isoform X5 n=1 Tax=Carcharodon carcharias TaxID=13397 RepID=UPI001B7E67A2|nr:zinc finger and BTB domain-containing protein 40 isoform X5 [Carcharodon carcharias]
MLEIWERRRGGAGGRVSWDSPGRAILRKLPDTMELPNYGRQLMQQLYTLRKEEQFCDCTLLIGNTQFRAHKLVLAASSLLFKSLLDNTDTISIDQAVVCPAEFAVLLEMVYTGKVPPGKHNFTKVVSVADNLQMFDIAVSCKNIMAKIMKHNVANEMRVSSPAVGQAVQHLERSRPTDTNQYCIVQELDKIEESAPNVTEITGAAEQSLPLEGLNCAGLESTGVALPSEKNILVDTVDPKQGAEHQENLAENNSTNIQDVNSLGCTAGGEMVNERASKKEGPRNLSEQEFLLQHKHDLAEAVQDLQALVDSVVISDDIPVAEKKVFLDCCKEAESSEVFCRLLDKVTEEKTLQLETLIFVLEQNKEAYPRLQTVLQNLNRNLPIERLILTGRIDSEDFLLNLYLHKEEVLECVTDLSPLLDCLDSAEEMAFSEEEKKVIVECCQGETARGAMAKLLRKVIEERLLSAETAINFLQTMKEAYPVLKTLTAEPAMAAKSELKNSEDYGFDLLRRYQDNIVDAVTDLQPLHDILSVAEDVSDDEKERIEDLIKGKDAMDCIRDLMEAVLEKQTLAALTVWKLLIRMKEGVPKLCALLAELQREPESLRLILSVSDKESKAVDILRRHRQLITDAIDDISSLLDCFMPGVENLPTETIEILKSCCYKETAGQSLESILGKILEERLIPALTFCRLLHMISESHPSLELVIKAMEHAGLMKEPVSDMEEDQKEDLMDQEERSEEDTEHPEDTGHDREGDSEPTTEIKKVKRKSGAKQSFICSACGKTFTFKCRLELHLTRCRSISHVKVASCEECGETRTSQKDLERHRVEVHDAPRGKRRRLPVTCDICGKSFAHQSGKMYGCQYCEAVFAQSIELTRHVRTHTGDKPYVCRECGKGFSQANGLSMHLRSFHNVEDPYDCQKCRMSFPTLEEHKKHIQEVHPPEYNPCDICGKNFSAPSLLERHMVTHIGGKPYNCDICDKAYQQLSGLWYHNRTHHPDIFAAQNHRSPKFATLVCSACEKPFGSTASLNKHMKSDHSDIKMLECEKCKDTFATQALLHIHMKSRHSGIHPFKCSYCSSTFRFPGALHHHLSTEHLTPQNSAFVCGDCAQLFNSQQDLEEHQRSKHAGILFANVQEAAQMVIQASEQMTATEQVISLEETHLSGVGSQVFVALPDSQNGSSGSHEIVAVNVNDLLDGSVTLICGETP